MSTSTWKDFRWELIDGMVMRHKCGLGVGDRRIEGVVGALAECNMFETDVQIVGKRMVQENKTVLERENPRDRASMDYA